MRVRTIVFDCVDPYPLVEFWSKATDFREDPQNRNEPDDPEGLLVGLDGRLNLLFIKVDEHGDADNPPCLDLIPTGRSRDEEVDRLLGIGATLVTDHREADGEGWVVLADPEGNLFSVGRRAVEPDGAASEVAFAAGPAAAAAAASPSWIDRLGFRRAPGEKKASTGPSAMTRLARRMPRELGGRLSQLIRLALLLVEALIAVRIILKVAGANEHAGFATFLYKVSSPFVGPFHPVFADHLVNGHPFEVGSLLAMGVYAALAYFVARLVRVVISSRR